MSNISKKLLSWLCVVAMVLSMVPVFQLPALAAEEAPEETFTPDETVTSAIPAEAQEAIAKAATIRAEAANVDFSGNYCPVCGPDVQVTWTKLTRAFPGSNNDNGATPNWTDSHPHFYWDPADFTNGTASYAYMNWLQNTKGADACIHLNGMRFENIYSRIHWAGGTLNIMGEGTFINSGDATKQAYGIFQMGSGTLNLYGGTFISTGAGLVAPTAKSSTYATVGAGSVKVTVNMYDGVVLAVNENDTQGTNVAMTAGTFNMYGGEIRGGKGYPYYDEKVKTTGTTEEIKASYDSFTTVGGNVFLRYSDAKFNMYGGKITGGTAPRGGNIAMYDSAYFTQYAGEISGGTSTETAEGHGGGNVKIQSGTFTQEGGVIKNGTAGYGGNIDTRSKTYIKGLVMDGTANSGANILAASGCLTYIQGGRVLRGNNAMNIMVYGSGNLYVQDGLIYGGKATNGANIYLSGNGNLQISGGVIRDGEAVKNGGNIFSQNMDSKITISGGQILNGKAGENGGNIRTTQGKLDISGGTISGGQATGAGGNIYYEATTASTETVAYGEHMLNITGGTITGGQSGANGGNISAKGSKGERTMNIDNAVISDGVAGGAGGNIYAESINVNVGANAQILNGVSNSADYKGGGNIAFNSSKTLTTAGQILDGKTTAAGGGGNISIMSGASMNITGGVIANGRCEGSAGTSWGGNIRSYNTDIIMTGGLIYGGYCKNSAAHNIGALGEKDGYPKLYVTDGTIVGDINISKPSGDFKGTDVKLAGAAKILDSYKLDNGTTVKAKYQTMGLSALHDISGLTADAKICIKADAGTVFTAPYTGEADLSGVFYAWDPLLAVEQNADGAFQVVKKVVEIPEKPAATLGGNNYTDEAWETISKASAIQAEDMAEHVANGTCPICGRVTWKEATYPGQFKKDDATNNTSHHFYIKADTKTNYNYNWCTLYGVNQTLCLALINGDTPVEVNGLIATRGGSENCTINILGDGIIINNDATGDKLGLLRVQGTNPTMNIYGGTFVRTFVEADGEKPKGALLVAESGTTNIFAGVTLGPDELDPNTTNYNVRIDKGTVNLYGGTIQNGVSGYADAAKTGMTFRYSGNITMTGAGATFNMYGGELKNGMYKASVPGATSGGNLLGQVDGQFVNIYGGVISGGKATHGGNLNVFGGAGKLTMLGGTVRDGVAKETGGNIRLQSMPAEFGGYALVENGEATNYYTTTVDGKEVTYALGGGGGNIHTNGKLTISGGEIRDGFIPNETQKLEDGKNASPAGGNVYQQGSTFTMTGGVIKNGSVKTTATGGGNIYFTSGATATITGGQILDGNSGSNGGNLYVYRGNLTVSGDTLISGGNAKNHGGNIYKYGGDAGYGNTLTHFISLGGDVIVKDGSAGNQGGNISLVASKLTVADNVQILDGHAKTGGNVMITGQNRKGAAIPDTDPVQYEYNLERATLEMTGGVIKGGTATNATQANIHTTNANVVMSGGEIYAADGNTANGAGLRISNSNLYLSGDAFIGRADGIDDCCLQIEPSGKMYIDSSWTGSALVQYNEPFAGGETIVTDDKYYTTWGTYTYAADETTGLLNFTFNQGEGTPYTGTLIQERAPFVAIVPAADGTVKLATAGVISESGSVWYDTTEEALADYDIDEDLFIYLSGDATINEDIKIELAGSKLNLSGKGTVYGLDSRNDGYSAYGEITIADDAEIEAASEAFYPGNGYRYIGIREGNKLSFHRISMEFTAVTLRTEGAGIYYKAKFQADDYLASKIESFGTVLSLANMPDDSFEYEDDLNIATELEGDRFVAGGVEITTASVYGILKDSRSQAANTEAAQMKIYANLYLRVITEDGVNSIITAESSDPATAGAGVAYSMIDVLAGINENWDNYSAEEKTTVQAFLLQWAPFITEDAAAQLQALLNKIFG